MSSYVNSSSAYDANKHSSPMRKDTVCVMCFSFCSKSCLITGLICSLNHLIAWKIWNSDSCRRQTCWKCTHTLIDVQSHHSGTYPDTRGASILPITVQHTPATYYRMHTHTHTHTLAKNKAWRPLWLLLLKSQDGHNDGNAKQTLMVLWDGY